MNLKQTHLTHGKLLKFGLSVGFASTLGEHSHRHLKLTNIVLIKSSSIFLLAKNITV